MLVSRDRMSLSPPSIIVIVETANGLPQAIPSSRLTSIALCLITLGWLACKLSIYSCGQFAARMTNLASPEAHASNACLCPNNNLPVDIAVFNCLLKSIFFPPYSTVFLMVGIITPQVCSIILHYPFLAKSADRQ